MSYYNDITTEINNKIAVLKTVTSDTTKIIQNKVTDPKNNVNGLMDSVLTIYDKICGYDDMISSIEEILSNKIDDIETTLKSSIKVAIKKIISCGIEPTISDILIENGMSFELKKVDPFSLFLIDPGSENGSYVYFDNSSGVDSKDFNVFLYSIIKQSTENADFSGSDWCIFIKENGEIIRKELFKANFIEYDVLSGKNNVLTIKINESYRNKKLSSFISDYLDSIKIFNNVQILSLIFDDILGSKIISLNKTTEQLTSEKMISNIVDKLIDNLDNENDFIDNSFYEFSNETYDRILEESENKKNGFIANTNIEINKDILNEQLNGLKIDDLSISEQTNILKNVIDEITEDLKDRNKINYTLNFKFDIVKKIIKNLTNAISMYLFSPKITYLFYMTNRLYNLNDPNSIEEYIKSNINIYKTIIVKVRDIITTFLTDKIKEKLLPLITKMSVELLKEKYAMYKKIIDTMKDAIDLGSNIVEEIIT